MKRKRFLAKKSGLDGKVGVSRNRPPAIGAVAVHDEAPWAPVPDRPPSPLSQLVQKGYPTPDVSPQRERRSAALPPRVPSGRPPSGAFDPNVAKQWSNNVQQQTAVHQQQHDPNFAGPYIRPTGYRVSQAPGGGSSISLSWDHGGETSSASARRDQGRYRSASPHAGGPVGATAAGAFSRTPSVGSSAEAFQEQAYTNPRGGGVRARSPNPNSMAAAFQTPPVLPGRFGAGAGQRAPSPGVSVSHGARSQSPGIRASYGGGGNSGGGAGHSANPPYGVSCQGESTGLNIGSYASRNSSNSYASGSSQNSGNGITDRRTTRVSKPPGGGSQICFG